MKLKPFLSLLVALIFAGNVGAVDGLIKDSSLQNNASADTENTLSWPVIPGENLNDMAQAFYPKNRAMRRLFIARTLHLNPTIAAKLKASTAFEEPTLIIIPTLKSLSKSKQAIRASKIANQNRQLNMSLNINTAVSEIPALLQQEYELLLGKNTFLKAELARLHQKISELQTQLSNMKLVLDKTLSLPESQANSQSSASDSANNTQIKQADQIADQAEIPPQMQVALNTLPDKKTFKNLDENSTNAVNTVAKQIKPLTQQSALLTQNKALEELEQPEQSGNMLQFLLLIGLGLLLLLAFGVYWIRRNRQRALTYFKESIPMMDDTLTDNGGQWRDTGQADEYIVEHVPQASTKNFMNTQMRDEQAKATSSLEEAKLLMSVNRLQDAIDHLKSSIETSPKTSINHWLYLLEIYRKLNAKDDFENYAQSLHRTFNVMTPVWYETNVAIIVPQRLEEFAHIIDKLLAVWPSDLAKTYLESLLTDNRDGERAGFSKAVLDEILMLIDLLETRKYFD